MSQWFKVLSVSCLICLVPVAALAGEAGKGEKGGFFIKDGDFSLNMEFRVQFKADYLKDQVNWDGYLYEGLADTEYDPKANFLMRRVRAAFSGTAFAPWLNYKLEVDYGRGKTALTDAFLDMRFSGANNWKFGQFNYPFDIFQMISDKTLMFVERPAGTEGSELIEDGGFFWPLNKSRDIGVMYYGYSEGKRFNWFASVMNGNGVNNLSNDNNKFRMGLRFEVQNEGGFKYVGTAADHPSKLEYTAGIAFQKNPRGSAMSSSNPTGLDDGGNPTFDCILGVSEECRWETEDVRAYELFGALRGKNFQITGTFQSWTYADGVFDQFGAVDDRKFNYWVLQGGYFVTPKLELALHYSQLKDTDPYYDFLEVEEKFQAQQEFIPVRTENKFTEWRLGINYYFFKNNLKLNFDWGQEKLKVSDEVSEIGNGELEFKNSGPRLMLSFLI